MWRRFLCGFEGAVLALHSDGFPSHAPEQRQAVANLWFSAMFARFKGHKRLTFGANSIKKVEASCAKLQGMAGAVTFDAMLAEICSTIGIFSKDKAEVYFAYWDAVLNHRQLRPPAAESTQYGRAL
jgi:hypothetical protein